MTTFPLKTHLALLLMSFITWGFFVLLGLPDYYQSWPFSAKVAICIAVTLVYLPLAPFILKRIDNQDFVKNSLWLALYLTLPLFIYDYVLIVLIGGDNLSFVFRYWYLSFFYFSFWIQFPLTARYIMNERLDSP
ncbi:hypothetical protein HRE53_21760 [Acaryochloris sp. 'Moss Beach']|uniref:hypothetical protein n=1 Tax=Acaryochloris sp. 'Moss Beach' TaxID=2740837 RepID=UPI001F25FC73|nr:hypothetical protein [Acaryochloris sp. 'Moss Beach']UJB69020.1 hypothetical protein HRE53_21760 [Acaryochloris sp. 'Moss Beach']